MPIDLHEVRPGVYAITSPYGYVLVTRNGTVREIQELQLIQKHEAVTICPLCDTWPVENEGMCAVCRVIEDTTRYDTSYGLQPCPFCGSEAESPQQYSEGHIQCSNYDCGFSGPINDLDGRRWNSIAVNRWVNREDP